MGKDALSVPLLVGGPHCRQSFVFLFSAVKFMGTRSLLLGTQGAVGLGWIDNFGLAMPQIAGVYMKCPLPVEDFILLLGLRPLELTCSCPVPALLGSSVATKCG